MRTLREFITQEALDATVNPETLNEEVNAIVLLKGGCVFQMWDGQLIFAPTHAPAFWDEDEPSLDNLLAGEVDGWEPDEDTRTTYF